MLLPLICVFLLFSQGIVEAEGLESQVAEVLSKGAFQENALKVVLANGEAGYAHQGRAGWFRLREGQVMVDRDVIKTGPTGYVMLAFSAEAALLIKPRSEITLQIDPIMIPRVRVTVRDADLLLAVQRPDCLELVGRSGTIALKHGDATFQAAMEGETITCLQGQTLYKPSAGGEPVVIPEGIAREIEPGGKLTAETPVDTRMGYERFKRFLTWLDKFRQINRLASMDTSFQADAVMIDGQFVSNLEVDKEGFRIIDLGNRPVPELVHIRLKLTPYPSPHERFDLYLNENFIFPLIEGGSGFFEARVPVPTFPEFTVKVRHSHPNGEPVRVFESRFIFYNRQIKQRAIREFLREVEMAVERKDTAFFRTRISGEYRDWFGNTYYEFQRLLEDMFRTYRDIRLILRPHTFHFGPDRVQVHLNFRLTALNRDWTYRFEDLGADVWTLELVDQRWRIRSKTRGMLFQRMKVVMDPRRGVLRGRILDEASGSPISGAVIRLLKTSFKTVSDRMGEYIIYSIPPGTYDVEITKGGFGKVTVVKMEIKATGETF